MSDKPKEKPKPKGKEIRNFLTTNNEVVMSAAQKDEPRFISILLKSKEKLQDAMAFGITPAYFRNKSCGFFYMLMVKQFEKHNSALTKHAMESIMDRQKDVREEDKSNRKSEWERLFIKEKSDEDYDMLKQDINDRYLQDQAFTIIEEEAGEIVNATSNQGEIVKRIQDRMNSIQGVDPDEFSLVMPFDKGTELAYDYIQNRKTNPEANQGIMSGIRALDEEYYGFERGSYTVISGMTNGGKTTLMFNIGFNMARAGHNVVYVSLEKKALPLNVRLLCLHAMVDYNRVKRGGDGERGINLETQTAIDKAVIQLEDLKPNFEIIQMSQDDTLTKIVSKIEEVKAQKRIDVVILDYLGCVGVESKTVGRHDIDQSNVSKRFQAYCKRNNFVGITGLQIKASATKEIRKKVEKHGQSDDIQDITIQSEDLAGSQEVIRDADNSIGVVLNADSPPTCMYAHSTKARDNQGHRTVELAFDGFIGKISDPVSVADDIQEINASFYGDDINNMDDLFSAEEAKEKKAKNKIAANDVDSLSDEPEPKQEEKSNTTVGVKSVKVDEEADPLDKLFGD